MPWLNADSKMYLHDKSRKAGLAAMGMWLMGATYSADNLTDGHVPAWYVDSWPQGKKRAEELVKARYWDRLDDGYLVRNWPEYQRTKEQVLAAQQDNAERRKRGGQAASHKRWHVDKGVISPDCPLCPGGHEPEPEPDEEPRNVGHAW